MVGWCGVAYFFSWVVMGCVDVRCDAYFLSEKGRGRSGSHTYLLRDPLDLVEAGHVEHGAPLVLGEGGGRREGEREDGELHDGMCACR